ncbi:anthranilate synthase component II [Pseudochelatococcus lubricantis]|uniref:anthranilate synthase component II n=1 Tax=Pseudochelatococcus lubricantis TaxID=1538102 RepID=UPI0035EE62BD
MARIVLIDNYDSFTWNLVHLVASAGPTEVDVYRNDAITVEGIRALSPDAVVLSPGPCTPNEAGICLDVITELGREIPLFGVCLGMQAMGQAYGGDVVRAPRPMHGKLSEVRHDGRGLFRGINGPFQATRYHSLIVDSATLPAELTVTAQADDLIMAVSHRTLPVHGVQFHPESILSEHGATIVRNFLDLAAQWNAHTRLPEPA